MIFLFNMGVPMIMPAMFFMVLALIPIVLIESFYTSRYLSIQFMRSIGSVTLANIVSTLAGIPATWFLLFLVQIITGGTSSYNVDGFTGKLLSVTLQAPWLLPFPEEEIWVFHGAALFLLIPFFFATWLIEYVVMRNKLASQVVEAYDSTELPVAERMVLKAVRNSNLLSYGLIALLLIGSLISVGNNPP